MSGKRYSPTRAGYEGWLYNGNTGSYNEFLEIWSEEGKKEILSDIYELLQQLNTEQLREIVDLIESQYL